MRLYVVGRRDLSVGSQAAQTGHALAELCVRQRDGGLMDWADNHKTLIIVSVKDEDELRALSKALNSAGVRVQPFFEPDMDDQMTAIAVHPSDWVDAQKKLSTLPLLGKERHDDRTRT